MDIAAEAKSVILEALEAKDKPKTNYYVLLIHGDIEPEVIGPFETEEARDQAAKALRADDSDMDNGIFSLNCTGKPEVDSYSGGYLGGEFDDN